MLGKFGNWLGFRLVRLGVAFMTKRNQRQFYLMVSLGRSFKQAMPREHEAIVTGDTDFEINGVGVHRPGKTPEDSARRVH